MDKTGGVLSITAPEKRKKNRGGDSRVTLLTKRNELIPKKEITKGLKKNKGSHCRPHKGYDELNRPLVLKESRILPASNKGGIKRREPVDGGKRLGTIPTSDDGTTSREEAKRHRP